MNLDCIYKKGNHWLDITIYEAGQVLPRKLAPENREFLRDGLAVVGGVAFVILLRKSGGIYGK